MEIEQGGVVPPPRRLVAALAVLVALLAVGLLAVSIYAGVTKGPQCQAGALPKGIRWRAEKPPRVQDGVVVYVSSGLFNLYELIYSVGIRSLAQKGSAASIMSDHIFDLVDSEGNITDPLVASYTKAMDIPFGGIAAVIAKAKMQSYIPARDGFNMAFFMSAAASIPAATVRKHFPRISDTDWLLKGMYLLEAVYGFDMYNLISRCNCCVFNANGIAMDDGSCAELGIATTRGLPTVIHHDQQTGNFGNHIVNPMIAGAAGYQLTPDLMQPDIPSAISALVKLLRARKNDSDADYAHYVPPPKLVSYWSNVGMAVWKWKYRTYRIRPDGTLDPSSYSAEYRKFIGMRNANLGKALIVAQIIELVKGVQKKFGVPEIRAPGDALATDASGLTPLQRLQAVYKNFAIDGYP